jgi:alkanesulfonate monooxygenase SsuD/methylene tetrahydromethanopterin reductase-like flavin-dependent oxidoreductase (luciferase family)
MEGAVKFGLDVPVTGAYADVHCLVDLAVEAEAAGWDGFFLQDVFSGPEQAVDPWVSLGAIAVATRRLRLGVFLTPLPRRQPWEVARQALTIDHASGGRLIFGAALGFDEREFTNFGLDPDPKVRAAQLDESLDVLTGLWSGEPYTASGDHYGLRDAQLLPKPLQQPRIPVWTAAGWPARRPLRRAAHWDGVYLMTDNQRTGKKVTATDVAAVRAFVDRQRAGIEETSAFDIATNGLAQSPDDPRVRALAEAGATWWVEHDDNQGLASYRQRIRSGPPEAVWPTGRRC